MLYYTDYDYADDDRQEAARESANLRRARRRLAELRGMHYGDPDFDPDEADALAEYMEESK